MDRKDRAQQPGFKPGEEKGAGKDSPRKPYGPGEDPLEGKDLLEIEEEGGMDLERPERDLAVRRPGDMRTDQHAKRSSGDYDDERNDRESGRPVQLESEKTDSQKHRVRQKRERRPASGDSQSRADREPGLFGSQQAGGETEK